MGIPRHFDRYGTWKIYVWISLAVTWIQSESSPCQRIVLWQAQVILAKSFIDTKALVSVAHLQELVARLTMLGSTSDSERNHPHR
jgi:hypothetical protein